MEKAVESLLVRRACAGDENAFAKLIDPLKDKIYWRALKALRDSDEAEDIAQETMIRAYMRIETFRGESRFSTWLYAVASNCIRMRLRTIKRKGALKIEDNQFEVEKAIANNLDYVPALPDRTSMNGQMFRAIDEAMAELPEKYSEVLRMWACEGMNLKEIHEFGDSISVPAIKSRLHRARKQLRSALDSKYGAGALLSA
jgi:RNA polymerase sigma-70 factor (ECF subfamily)